MELGLFDKRYYGHVDESYTSNAVYAPRFNFSLTRVAILQIQRELHKYPVGRLGFKDSGRI